jgi:hypothetical protein
VICIRSAAAFRNHGFVEEDLEDLGEGAGAFVRSKPEKVVKESLLGVRVGNSRA